MNAFSFITGRIPCGVSSVFAYFPKAKFHLCPDVSVLYIFIFVAVNKGSFQMCYLSAKPVKFK